MRKPFPEVLKAGEPLLFDGAMGTVLYNKGIFINRCFEESCLSNPQLVREIHQEYVAAGADILTTNSFGANELKLRGYNLGHEVLRINQAAAQLAREVAGDETYVAGSVGPLGVRIEPWGPTSFAEAQAYFIDQIRSLVAGGVDLICLETFADLSELQQALLAARAVASGIPVIAHIAIDSELKTLLGTPLEWAAQKLDTWNVDVIGLNCSVGPASMMTAVAKIQTVSRKPLCLQPNAGLPKLVEDRHIYMSTPEYLAEFCKSFLQAGVQFVGGCCGTTPEHIRAMAQSMRQCRAFLSAERQFRHPHTAISPTKLVQTIEAHEQPASKSPALESRWARKIAAGERVCSVELLPPAGVSPEKILENARKVRDGGVDAINIPDGPRASARMSAILTAVMIEQQAGIETVLHYTCRDRNLLSMQSDFLGAYAIGLRNMLLVTGDPPKLGSYPNATGVFDVDAIGLTNMVARLNQGMDLGGRSIGKPTAISIGVGVNPVHRDFDYEMKRFRYKVEAGATWAITQPVFDVEAMWRFLEYIRSNGLNIPVIAGVWPLLSYRNAVFMNNEVPGVTIPEGILRRMEVHQDPESAQKVGVEIAQEMIEQLGPNVQGLQVSAPFGRVELALTILKGL